MVVEAMIKEQVGNISEAIQGLCIKITELEVVYNTRDTTGRKSEKGTDYPSSGGED
jgi:hypothetical protein